MFMSKKSNANKSSYISKYTTKLTTLSSRHSQSALEYMMTYGWAILIIVIVAAGLYSLGIFSPTNSASTSITGFTGLETLTAVCYSNLTGSGYSQNIGLVLTFGNGIGSTINITYINVTNSGVSKSFSIKSNDIVSPNGNAGIFEVPNVCPQSTGSRYSAIVTITYTEPGQTFSGPYYSSGTVSGTTLAGSGFPSTIGLVAFWPFQEGSGTIVHDLSGNGYNGNILGTATWTFNPRFGYVFDFNGGTDINTTYTQTAVTQYTVFAWVNMSGSSGVITQDRGSGTGHSLTLFTSSAGCGNPDGESAFVDDSNGICTGVLGGGGSLIKQWYSLAGVFNAPAGSTVNANQFPQEFSVFVNGTPVSAGTSGGSDTSPLTGLGGLVIGYSIAWNSFFVGQMTNIHIYNRTLTQNEIREMTLYNTLI